MIKYLNMKLYQTIDTVDSFNSNNYSTLNEFYKAIDDRVQECQKVGYPVYVSKRKSKDWRG